MIERENSIVDTRILESGLYRLRFRLSPQAYEIVVNALSLTGYSNPATALDAIAVSTLAGNPAVASLGIPAAGRERFLVRLYPDQYENVRLALDEVRRVVQDDHEALVAMCAAFIKSESTNQPMKEYR